MATTAWTRCVRDTARKYPGLKGKTLFRKASSLYTKKSNKSSSRKTRRRRRH